MLEGPEGSGKSTLLRSLAERARAAGLDPVVVREPGGTSAGEAARAILLDHDHPLGPQAELFLFLAARAELVRQVIRPALEAGRLVLADRYEMSTLAYQVAGRGLDESATMAANAIATGGLRPDLTLIVDLTPDEGRARQVAAGKQRDRLDRETEAFHARVSALYLATVAGNVRHLDGRLAPPELAEAAWAALRESSALTGQ